MLRSSCLSALNIMPSSRECAIRIGALLVRVSLVVVAPIPRHATLHCPPTASPVFAARLPISPFQLSLYLILTGSDLGILPTKRAWQPLS